MSNITEAAVVAAPPPDLAVRRVPGWIWVHVAVAALAMVATLPGRTHGLGLITEPLLRDLQLPRVRYAEINLWATLLGAAFCLPCGWLIDRCGIRIVLAGVTWILAGVVLLMSQLEMDADYGSLFGISLGVFQALFLLVLLTRGFGQSALSVVSLALVGKAAGRTQGPAIGIYSFLMAVGFMASFGIIKYVLGEREADWRDVWGGIGTCLLAFGGLACLLVRPDVTGWAGPETGPIPDSIELPPPVRSWSIAEALCTPAFWVFGLATSVYGLIVAGISLFNQSILQERGFNLDVFLTITTVSPMIGLAANLATGWLATRWPLGKLLAMAMLLLALALVVFPLVETLVQVYLYAATLGVAGGMITVIFFAVWGQAFGPAHLGKIQGAAQMLTVFASALGPLLLAVCNESTGSYVLFFQCAAVAAAVLGVAAWWTRLPSLVPQPSNNTTNV